MRLETAVANAGLLSGVDQRTLKLITDSLIEERWSKGQQLMGPVDSAASFRLIAEGRVKIVRSDAAGGREVTLWLLGPGDGFDIVSLLDGRQHAVSAWAVDEVHTLGAPMSLWRGWLEQSRPLRLAAHRYIADRLRDICELAGELALQDTAGRLAHLLLRHYGSEQDNLLRDLPQRELASLVGSVRVVVSRVLAQMKRHGIVDLHGGAIRAVDLQRLLKKAQSELPPASTHGVKAGHL
jgi:CRP-like cAMP-binding protein